MLFRMARTRRGEADSRVLRLLRAAVALAISMTLFGLPSAVAPASAVALTYLSDGNFETDPWAYYSVLQPSKNDYFQYCNGGGYRSNCYVEFNGGRSDAVSLYQDTYMSVTGLSTNVVADAMVRCPAGQGDCTAVLAVWGDPGKSTQESQSVLCHLPADNRWYHLRLDGADGILGNGDPTFWRSHQIVRWELYDRTPHSNLDVDDAALHDESQGSYFVILGSEGVCTAVDENPGSNPPRPIPV
jgi:hypothetical protein